MEVHACHNVLKFWQLETNDSMRELLGRPSAGHGIHPGQKAAVLQDWWSQASPQNTAYIIKNPWCSFLKLLVGFLCAFSPVPLNFKVNSKHIFQAHFPSSPIATRARNVRSQWAEIFMLSVNCSRKELNCHRTGYVAKNTLRWVVLDLAVTTF